MTAVMRGPREVAGAITASTLTTVAVFLPLGFVGGLVSQFFLPFALTVTFALLASLICALTVVPVLAYLFIDRVTLNVDETGEPKRSFWVHVYVPVITTALRNRRTQWAVLDRGCGPVRRLGVARPEPADPVHQRRLGEDPGRRRRSADGDELEGGPRPGRQGRGDHPGQTRGRARPDERPGRGRDRLQHAPRGRSAAGPPTAPRSPSGSTRRPISRPRRPPSTRPSPRSTPTASTTSISEAAGFTSNNLNVIVSGQDPALVGAASDAVVGEAEDPDRPGQRPERRGQGQPAGPGDRRSEQGDPDRLHGRPGRGGGPERTLADGGDHGHARRRDHGRGGRPARSRGDDLDRRPQEASGRDRSQGRRSAQSRRSRRSTPRAASPGSTRRPPRRSAPRSPARTPVP